MVHPCVYILPETVIKTGSKVVLNLLKLLILCLLNAKLNKYGIIVIGFIFIEISYR